MSDKQILDARTYYKKRFGKKIYVPDWAIVFAERYAAHRIEQIGQPPGEKGAVWVKAALQVVEIIDGELWYTPPGEELPHTIEFIQFMDMVIESINSRNLTGLTRKEVDNG